MKRSNRNFVDPIDWTISDEQWNEAKEDGLGGQIFAAQAHWARLCQKLSDADLLELFKRLTEDYYDAWWGLRYCGSSGDTVSWLDRKRLAVIIAIGAKLTEAIECEAVKEFDRRCEATESEIRLGLDPDEDTPDEVDPDFTEIEAKADSMLAEGPPEWLVAQH